MSAGYVAAWVPGDRLPGVWQSAWTRQPLFALKDDHVQHCACQDEDADDWDGSGRSARWTPALCMEPSA